MADSSVSSKAAAAAAAPTPAAPTPAADGTEAMGSAPAAAAPAPDPSSSTPNAQAIQFNPISKWEEPIEVPGLTLWDVHCAPRQVNEDPNARIRVSVKQLSSEFHCPVCLGYFNKPVTVMECLHRFCSECIEKCLRIGKKECPSCRIHIPSRRSLRNDSNFEDLMRSIYGDIDRLESHEAREIATLNKAQNMNNAAQHSRKLGILEQNRARGKKRPASPTGDSAAVGGGGERSASIAAGDSSAAAAASSPHGARPTSGLDSPPAPKVTKLHRSSLIQFTLRRHPKEIRVDRLDKEAIKTSKDMTIETIKKFLGKKLSHAPHTDFQIICSVGGKPVILDDTITVGQVKEGIIDNIEGTVMVLQYRLLPAV